MNLSKVFTEQVIVAEGTSEVYQGRQTTVLLPDVKTMIAVWTLVHGGTCGPMKQSEEVGRRAWLWSQCRKACEGGATCLA